MNQKGEINIDVFCEQLPQVEDFVKCLTYYQCIGAMGAIPIKQSEFWDDASIAFIGMAIIAWYNVFVHHKSNVYWSKTVRDMPTEIEDFKGRISKSTGLNGKEYEDYQTSIKDVRDKYIAHRDINWMAHISTSFLNLDIALNIAKEYEGWIRDLHKRKCTDYSYRSFDQSIKTAKREINDVATALKKTQKTSKKNKLRCSYE